MYLAQKNRIPLNLTDLKLDQLDNYKIINLDIEIVEMASQIEGIELHDQLILSSAKYLNIPILTNDEKIRNSKLIQTIWNE